MEQFTIMLGTLLNLLVAATLGAVIGVERQVRQRLAGLRTNALVALGAASFVHFSSFVDGEMSPTRVASQVVSGIGFLGAGVILRDGGRVRGLNTAATLWCSAAVGLFAGSGFFTGAVAATAIVLLINVGLRPLVRAIDRNPQTATEVEHHSIVTTRCSGAKEAKVRALLLQAFKGIDVHLIGVQSHDLDTPNQVEVSTEVVAMRPSDDLLESAVGRLSLEPAVTAANWRRDGVITRELD